MSIIRNIPRMINLNPVDYRIIRNYAKEKGLGKKSFSIALSLIIRDWYALRMIRMTQDKSITYNNNDSTKAIAIAENLPEAKMVQEAQLRRQLEDSARLRKEIE